MTLPQTHADQRAYLEDGLRDVTCDRCGAQVGVRKNSPQHTSVQWTVRAGHECAEFAARRAAGELSAVVATCGALRESIERAVREGVLPTSSPPVP